VSVENAHRVLVYGGRNYEDRTRVFELLSLLVEPPTVIVHGACGWDAGKPEEWSLENLRGADRWAHEYALSRNISVETHPANWTMFGRRAGPKRNHQMVESSIDFAVGFPGGSGTVDMCDRINRKRIRHVVSNR
jgi:hypothetical protein